MPPATGRVAVLGAPMDVQGFALAGAVVVAAGDDSAVRSAWRDLPDDVSVVVLTRDAAVAVADLPPRPGLLTVVMP